MNTRTTRRALMCSAAVMVFVTGLTSSACWAGSGQVRDEAVAGAWYPSEPDSLRRLVDRLLAEAPGRDLKGDLVALVAPHAGFAYSGPTAAAAYRQVEGRSYEAVVVLAPSHRESFRGASVYAKGAYRTPLGEVPVAEDLAREIVREGGRDITAGEAGHRSRVDGGMGEHALEAQLPFLQRVLGGLTIVPIMIGDCSPAASKRIAEAIVRAIGEREVLLVSSTDLYHGYSEQECIRTDTHTVNAIRALDGRAFAEGVREGSCQACGGWPTAVTMMAARAMGATRADVLARTHSNAVTGQTSGWVVGYCAAAFIRPGKGSEKGLISPGARAELLAIARRSATCAASGEPPPALTVNHPELSAPGAAFVTLTDDGRLRGCIGRLLPTGPLGAAVQEMARAAALEDSRFEPVRARDVDRLHIEISVLGPFEPVSDLTEVRVGTHGLYMQKGGKSGLLLPQVPVDFGWDRQTFLEQVCQKAGLPRDAWRDGDARFWAFEAEVFEEE
jgi:MEMO1 family protein